MLPPCPSRSHGQDFPPRCTAATQEIQVDYSEALLQPFISNSTKKRHKSDTKGKFNIVGMPTRVPRCPPTESKPVTPPPRRLRCSHPASLKGSDVRLLVGIMSSPHKANRRNGIRQTWMRWPSVGQSVLICFVIGRMGPTAEHLATLDIAAKEYGDILFLPKTPDGCSGQFMHIAKPYEWWRLATKMAAYLEAGVNIAKVDDDTLLHLPHLEAELHALRCVGPLFYGQMVWCGFNPSTFKQCGWSWSGGGNFHKYGCAKAGFHPAMPYALGALEVLSTDVAKQLVCSSPFGGTGIIWRGAIATRTSDTAHFLHASTACALPRRRCAPPQLQTSYLPQKQSPL